MQAGYRAPKKAKRSADAVRLSGRQHGRNRHRETPDGSAGSKTPRMHGNSMHGNREIPVLPAAVRKRRAGGGTHKGTPLMNGAGKSDSCAVPEKDPNKGRPAEGLEGRRLIKENAMDEHTNRTRDREIVSRGLQGVREAAQRDKG